MPDKTTSAYIGRFASFNERLAARIMGLGRGGIQCRWVWRISSRAAVQQGLMTPQLSCISHLVLSVLSITRAIIYGAVEARESRNEALRNGAVEVLSEPGLPADLTDVLREYLPKSQGTSRKPDAVTTGSE